MNKRIGKSKILEKKIGENKLRKLRPRREKMMEKN
jgi:hypothetical protein